VTSRLNVPVEAPELVTRIAAGTASMATLAALGAEERHIVPSDRRSFLVLAARSSQPATSSFFSWLAESEGVALGLLPAFTTAAGLTEEQVREYEPMPGCQTYPSYVAWLALGGEPIAVAVAVAVNFAAWGGYCATIAGALRKHYGFSDEACAFFDFFAGPGTELQDRASAAVQSAMDAGRNLYPASRYVRLSQAYELSFWDTLAGLDPP
jgi:hypothetical protein